MSIEEYTELTRQRLEQMAANRGKDAELMAFDLKAAIQLRIQTEGVNYKEVKFNPYSNQHTKTRKDLGYQTEYVDYTMTGELWNDIQPRIESETPTSTTVSITARRKENFDKLRGAYNVRGDEVLRPSQKEIDLLNALNRRRINKYFNF